jgi:hypothetical protein
MSAGFGAPVITAAGRRRAASPAYRFSPSNPDFGSSREEEGDGGRRHASVRSGGGVTRP